MRVRTVCFVVESTSGDERLSEANRRLESTKSALSLEVTKLKTELAEHVRHTERLNDQVSDVTGSVHSLSSDRPSLL